MSRKSPSADEAATPVTPATAEAVVSHLTVAPADPKQEPKVEDLGNGTIVETF